MSRNVLHIFLKIFVNISLSVICFEASNVLNIVLNVKSIFLNHRVSREAQILFG